MKSIFGPCACGSGALTKASCTLPMRMNEADCDFLCLTVSTHKKISGQQVTELEL